MLGRKRLSVTSASRIGRAAKKAGGLRRESGDVGRAKENAARLERQIAELERKFEEEAQGLDAVYDAQLEELAETTIAPRSADIDISLFGIGWLPSERPSINSRSNSGRRTDRSVPSGHPRIVAGNDSA